MFEKKMLGNSFGSPGASYVLPAKQIVDLNDVALFFSEVASFGMRGGRREQQIQPKFFRMNVLDRQPGRLTWNTIIWSNSNISSAKIFLK